MLAFLQRFLRNPKMIGALFPSSERLVRAMTAPIEADATVLEVGAGSGAITARICAGHGTEALLVFEQDRLLARHLRERFAGVPILEGLFHEALAQIHGLPEKLVIVSSVPFRSVPDTVHRETVRAMCRLLLASPQRKLVQFTYFNAPPFAAPHSRLRWQRIAVVWDTLSPATVWELRLATGLSHKSAQIETFGLQGPVRSAGQEVCG